MEKVNWHKVVTREYSFLWASYTASAYKIMKRLTGTELRYNLFYTQGRILTIYREAKDVRRSYKLINDLASKKPQKILEYLNHFKELVRKNYETFNKIKKIKNKMVLKKELINLDKLFLETVVYYLYFVFLGYAADQMAIKRFLSKYKKQFEEIRMFTIDLDMHKEFERLFVKFDKKLKGKVLFMTRQELLKSLKGQKTLELKIQKRKGQALMITKNGVSGEYQFNKIQQVLDFELSHLKIDRNVETLEGKTACQGKARGTVVLVFKREDYKKIRKGNILVTPMTKPEIVPYIKNVKAIITNDGGALSHASIISRELSIPCIVGTTYATDILKDNDLVEVDANKGIVKILKKI